MAAIDGPAFKSGDTVYSEAGIEGKVNDWVAWAGSDETGEFEHGVDWVDEVSEIVGESKLRTPADFNVEPEPAPEYGEGR